jgi:prepilin-type N-terminal cleavage/methylation domain-containing protein
MPSKKSGFTLVEILVAIAIVSILASVIFANLGEARKKAHDTQRANDLGQIQVALRVYRDAYSSDYPTAISGEEIVSTSGVGQMIAPYITNTITDPLNGTAGYGYYYDSAYTCNGTSHVVVIAQAMERTNAGNFLTTCGAGPYEATTGITPTTNSYIVILK